MEQKTNLEELFPSKEIIKMKEKELIQEFLDLTPLDKEIRKDFSELLNLPNEKFRVAVKKIRDTLTQYLKTHLIKILYYLQLEQQVLMKISAQIWMFLEDILIK